MEYKNILYEEEAHVVTITLNRPAVHNCINHETNLELQHAWKQFRDDENAFVAIFTGAGDKAFSAGWDLNDAAALESMGTYDQFRVAVHNNEGYCGYTKKFDIFKPIIAAVNGYAFAAGLESCLLADIRLASEIVPQANLMERTRELAHQICELPQGSIRTDKETVVRGVGRTVEERTFIETEGILTMFLRQDKHTEGAGAFIQKRKPDWKGHGL